MTDATATFYDVPAIFDGSVSPLGELRRVIRVAVNGAAIGLGTVAALCVLVATVTLTAAWIVNTALATNPKSIPRRRADLRRFRSLAAIPPWPLRRIIPVRPGARPFPPMP
jgi:hypothetical protein